MGEFRLFHTGLESAVREVWELIGTGDGWCRWAGGVIWVGLSSRASRHTVRSRSRAVSTHVLSFTETLTFSFNFSFPLRSTCSDSDLACYISSTRCYTYVCTHSSVAEPDPRVQGRNLRVYLQRILAPRRTGSLRPHPPRYRCVFSLPVFVPLSLFSVVFVLWIRRVLCLSHAARPKRLEPLVCIP